LLSKGIPTLEVQTVAS